MMDFAQGSELVVWVLTFGMVLAGIAGTVLPALPGHLLIFLAALVPWFALPDHGGLAWWGLFVLALFWVAAQGVEMLSGAVGVRWFGGSRWGFAGALVGTFVGLFFLPLGLILGPLLGAFALEWLFAKKGVREATVSGVGSAVGTLTGLVLKIFLAVLMALYLVGDLFWWG